jgi:hypothetical protein
MVAALVDPALLKAESDDNTHNMKKYFDVGNASVIAVTFILFVVAMFMKGFTKDLLLEAGVFLVSIKIILMSYKNSMKEKEILDELKLIRGMLEEKNNAAA